MSEFPAPPPIRQSDFAPGSSGPSGPRAGFWRRFAASVVDGLMIGVLYVVILLIAGRVGAALVGILAIVYYTYFEGSNSGQTIGKRALGIRVIDFNSGGSIGYGRALIRTLGHIISSLPCYLGYFWMLWDKERQCWHDKFATDVVVPVSSYPVARWPN